MSKALTLTVALNKQEKSIVIDAKTTVLAVLTECAKHFKIDINSFDLLFNTTKLENEKQLIKGVIGNTAGAKLHLKEKVKVKQEKVVDKKQEVKASTKEVTVSTKEVNNSKANKKEDAKVKESFLDVKVKQVKLQINTNLDVSNSKCEVTSKSVKKEVQRAILKITEFQNLDDLLELTHSLIDKNHISKESFTKVSNLNQLNLEFEKVDDGHAVYQGLQYYKNSDKRYGGLKVILYLGKSYIKEYHHPLEPKCNMNRSMVEEVHKALSTKNIKTNFQTISTLSQSFKVGSPLGISTMKHSQGSTKINIIKHLNYYEEARHDPVKIRELMINNQQKLLNKISPTLVNISTPYISEEERRLLEENKAKEKWIDKKGFKQATSIFAARKLPVISNYVRASPSLPPINHNFREVRKDHWVNKNGFYVC